MWVVCGSATAQGPERRTSLTGTIEHIKGFESKVLGNRRDLVVYLPPNYAQETNRRYPVLYLHDGQNVFDGMTSFLPNVEWRTDETAEALIRAGLIEPIVMVGIANAGMDRANEYLPTEAAMRGGPKTGGKLRQYGEMLLTEIKPMIDKRYRTRPEGRFTGVLGSSFGGIATMGLGVLFPESFGRLGVVSPSVWWDDRQIVKMVQAMPKRPNQRIWLDIGTAEGPNAVADTLKLRDALVAKGWREGRDLAVYIDGGAPHNEAAWSSRFGEMLMFLYGRR